MKTIIFQPVFLIAVITTVLYVSGCQKTEERESSGDDIAPQIRSILINSGDASTDSVQVNLLISATDDVAVTAYYVSENSIPPAATATDWISVTATQDYVDTVSFVLSSGDGEKIVHAWFKDAADNISNELSDSIELDLSSTESCSVLEKNEFLYDLMQDVYLWYDRMPSVDYTAYASPEALLDALRYTDLDKWSYITQKETHDRFFNEGQTIGMGVGYHFDGVFLWVTYVLNSSPAELAGLSRGDKLLEINGKTLQEIIDESIPNANLGPDEEDVVVNLLVQHVTGESEDVTVTKKLITIDTVHRSTIIEVAGKKIGYLVFMQFLGTSSAELAAAFDNFKAEAVDELVLDLRYNGGGYTSVANYLSKLIAGNNVVFSDIFARYLHNDKHTDNDWVSTFGTVPDNALNLDRLVVITTRGTASASELVINGLRPFLNEIVLIGAATHGKPVGMYSWDFCDMVVVPISFQVKNANWEGEYYEGFTPTCVASDELTQTFGSLEENSLQEALFYIENDACSPLGSIQPALKSLKYDSKPFPGPRIGNLMHLM